MAEKSSSQKVRAGICAACSRLESAAQKYCLTEKQKEICAMIGGGETYKGAAERLKISRMAVYWRVRGVMRKTKSVTLAAAFFRLGLA